MQRCLHRYIVKNKGAYTLLALSCLLKAFAAILMAAFFQQIIDAIVSANFNRFLNSFVYAAAVILGQAVTETINDICQSHFVRKCNVAFKDDLFSAMISADINTFGESNSAKYISILNNDIKQVENDYFRNICSITYAVILFAFAFVSMCIISVPAGIFAVIICALPLMPPAIFGKKISAAQKAVSESQEEYNGGIKDIFNGFEVFKSFGAEKPVQRRFSFLNNFVELRNFIKGKKVSYCNGFIILIGELSFISVTIFLSALAITKHISVGMMLAGIQLTNYFTNPMQIISSGYTNIKGIKAVEKRAADVLGMAGGRVKPLPALKKPAPIELDSLTFGYYQGQTVLSGVSAVFEAGKKYVVVGASGCGKSTLIKLLMQYYPGYEGRILFGGQDARNVDKLTLYRQVALIHQNIVLFDDTLKNNITLFGDYPDSDVINAAKEAGLEEFLNQKADGLKTHVEENGKNFSGGERQRIAIARAFIRKTPVLILDEATSGLDSRTASQIENTIIERGDITAIVITHKISESLLKKYDRIIAIRDGKIYEQGTFDELIARKDYFYSLFTLAS